jgi:hypothetical protein
MDGLRSDAAKVESIHSAEIRRGADDPEMREAKRLDQWSLDELLHSVHRVRRMGPHGLAFVHEAQGAAPYRGRPPRTEPGDRRPCSYA